MKKRCNFIIIGLLTFIFFFITNYFTVVNNDLVWNYGFSYNYANGLKMYVDYNMVITPLYPFIIGSLLKILGDNIIIFYLINALIPTSIAMLVYKEDKKLFIPMLLTIEFVSFPNYNLLCVLLLFILMRLEQTKKNDYIIGILIGLSFLTKSSIGVFLCLPTLVYIKEFRKVLKRAVGFLIPVLITVLLLYFNKSLYSFVNYAFLGLFDFAESNSKAGLLIIVTILSLIFLGYKYYKTKEKEILYAMAFQIMAYPIFNAIHVVYALIPVVYIVIKYLPDHVMKIYDKYYKLMLILLLCPLGALGIVIKTKDLAYYPSGTFKYKAIEQTRIDDANMLKEHLKDDVDDVIFVMYEAYMNKFILDIPINKYDLLLEGNLGYDGVNKIIEEFDDMPKGTKFVTYLVFEQGQSSEKLYNHITNNYYLVDYFDKYEVYVK